MTTTDKLPLPPGPGGIGVLRFLHRIHDTVDFFEHYNEKYGDIVFFRMFNRNLCLVYSAEIMEEVFITHRTAFVKGPFYRNNRVLVNPTTMSTVGDEHRRLRKLVQPSFRAQALKEYAEIMVDTAVKMRSAWQEGEQINVDPLVRQLALDTVAVAFFGRDSKVESSLLQGVLDAFTWDFILTMLPFGRQISKLPLGPNIRAQQATEAMDGYVYDVIAKARSGDEQRTDLISYLVHSKDEEGIDPALTDGEIRDETYIMLMAGHETSANTLVWCFYHLSCHPDVLARVENEVDEVLGERRPTPEDYGRLPYISAVVDEVLRISPPSLNVGRQAIEDCVLGGYRIPKGTVIHQYLRGPHWNEKYWKSPGEFRPERWLEPVPPERPKHAYVPFGAGESKCIGYHFAKMEMTLVLAAVFQWWRVQPLSTDFPKLRTANTFYKMKGGLPCTVHRRKHT